MAPGRIRYNKGRDWRNTGRRQEPPWIVHWSAHCRCAALAVRPGGRFVSWVASTWLRFLTPGAQSYRNVVCLYSCAACYREAACVSRIARARCEWFRPRPRRRTAAILLLSSGKPAGSRATFLTPAPDRAAHCLNRSEVESRAMAGLHTELANRPRTLNGIEVIISTRHEVHEQYRALAVAETTRPTSASLRLGDPMAARR